MCLSCHSHNDLAWQIQDHFQNQLAHIDLTKHSNETMTDIPRLREGLVGAQVRQTNRRVDEQTDITVCTSFACQTLDPVVVNKLTLSPVALGDDALFIFPIVLGSIHAV